MKNKSYRTFFFASFALAYALSAQAQGVLNTSKGISFQGVIKTPSGQFPTISGTSVVVKILSPNDCVLREERISEVNISNGYLNLVIGRGVPTANNPSPARELRSIMNNSSSFTNLTCLNTDGSINSVTTSYDPQPGDVRKLRISMQIDQDNVVADFNMRAVAYAVNAESLNGKSESNFINVNSVDGLTQANAESIFQRYTQLNSILNGSFTGNVIGNVSGTASNITGVVALSNGGTGASTAEGARAALELKALALIDLPSSSGDSKFLRGDGTWASVVGGVSSVAGRAGDVVITTADLADFNTVADARATDVVTGLKGQLNGLATLDAGGKVPSTQLGLTSADIPQLDAAKINSGTLTVPVNSISVNAGTGQFTQVKVNDGAGKTVTMTRQAGGADYTIQWPATGGAAGSVLQTDATGVLSWVAIPSAPVQSVAGRTGTVTLAKEDISGLGTAAGLNAGSSANNLVQLDVGAKIPVSLLPSTGGDLSGDIANASVIKIRGNAVSLGTLTAPDVGKIYRWTGTAFTASYLNFGDLRTVGGAQQLGAICGANEKIQWSVIVDAFTCQPIGSLNASAISSGTVDSARLPAASSSADGIINQIAQSFSGLKTFLNGLSVTGDVSATGVVAADRIKVSNSTVPCNASNEGSIRYNSTTKKFEGCNGTIWANISQGTVAAVSIGAPSSNLVKSGPVTFDVNYGSGTDLATINLTSGKITINGANSGCAVTGVTGTGSVRTVTVNNCTGTGSVSISIAAGTANSTTGDEAGAAGPSSSYTVDNTGPSAPTSVVLGSVPTNFTNSPTITYSPGTDVGGSTVANHQVRITKTSDGTVIKDWTNHSSGADVGGLTLATSTQYSLYIRAVDGLGNVGTTSSAIIWTSANIPVLTGTTYSGGRVVLNGYGVLYYITGSGAYNDFTFNVPGGLSSIDVTVIGGGGGNTGGGSGGGAGAGGARSIVSVTKSSYSLRVGGGMNTHWATATYGSNGDSTSMPSITWFDTSTFLYATGGGGSSGTPGQGYNGNVHNSKGGSRSTGVPVVTSTGSFYNQIIALDTAFQGDAGGRGQGLSGFSAESSTAGLGLGGGGGGQNSINYGGSSSASVGGRYGYSGGAVGSNGLGPTPGIQGTGPNGSYINGGGGGSFGAGGGDDGSGGSQIGDGGGGAGGAVLIRWDTTNGMFINARPGFP